MAFVFELGDTVRDGVTNFRGVVIARAEHITGCNTYGVQPSANENKFDEARWFDEQRLTAEGGRRVTLTNAVDGAGPNPSSTRPVGRS